MVIRFREELVAPPSNEIRTQRLLLRPICAEDAELVFQNFTAEITRFMRPAPPRDRAETAAFIRRALSAHDRRTDFHWAIENGGTGEFLGVCGLHGSRHTSAALELGIWLKKEAHGSSYGLEAVEGVVGWVSANVACDDLIYPVDKANVASRRIPERLRGEIIGDRTALSESGMVLNEVVYRIPLIPGNE